MYVLDLDLVCGRACAHGHATRFAWFCVGPGGAFTHFFLYSIASCFGLASPSAWASPGPRPRPSPGWPTGSGTGVWIGRLILLSY